MSVNNYRFPLVPQQRTPRSPPPDAGCRRPHLQQRDQRDVDDAPDEGDLVRGQPVEPEVAVHPPRHEHPGGSRLLDERPVERDREEHDEDAEDQLDVLDEAVAVLRFGVVEPVVLLGALGFQFGSEGVLEFGWVLRWWSLRWTMMGVTFERFGRALSRCFGIEKIKNRFFIKMQGLTR